nr:butyrophilin subfamily 2 member A1-like isoform X5 [Anas platyrhynchos]XP_038028072.1 butyrophilin subfamily 2 member A1-like isoform X5 [Anas platyrhynchos]
MMGSTLQWLTAIHILTFQHVSCLITAKGSVPSISLRSYMKQSIGLTCHADGWFPKPEVIWLDGQGQVRKEQSTTKMMMMPSGLYRVITSMNLKPGSDMEVSCRIVNNLLKTTRESRIQISEIFFPSISKWLIVHLVILCFITVLISTVFCKLRSNHKKTIKSVKMKTKMEEENEQLKSMLAKSKLKDHFGQLKAELDFWEARSHAVFIDVNPDCRVLELPVPGTPKVEDTSSEPESLRSPSTVPVLVGKEGFAAGKHYWEVEVDQQQDWVLGVVREKEKQEEEGTNVGEDFWALHRSQGELFSSKESSKIEKKNMSCSVIGVLLDLEEAQVKFYEAGQKNIIVKIPLSLGKEHAEIFYPFLPKGEEGVVTPVICPVFIPVPLETL